MSSRLKAVVAVSAALVLLPFGVTHAEAQAGHAPAAVPTSTAPVARAAAAVTLGQVASTSPVACAPTPHPTPPTHPTR